jgi:ATP/ADP translocase
VIAATLTAFALIAQQVAAKAVRDALFLSSFDVEVLPSVMSVSALVAMLAVLVFSRAMAASSPARLMPLATAASAGLLAVEWGLALARPQLAALAVYMHVAIFGATLVSGFWSLVNERFDPHTARKAVAPIGMGASLGGVAGGGLAWLASGLVELPAMLALLAFVNALCCAGMLRLRRSPNAPEPAHAPSQEISGLRILRQVPYLRDLALIVCLGALVEALLDYVLNARAAVSFASGQQLVSFFALFHGGVGLLALALQVLLTRRSLARLGLAGTVAMQPAAVAAAGLLALASPRLSTAVLVRGVQAAIHNSLFRSGYELFYMPVPHERKRPTKAIVDVGSDKLGTAAGGVVALAIVALFPRASYQLLLGLAVSAALVVLYVCHRLHRGYVRALEESLRSGAVRLDIGEIVDSTTRFTLANTNLALDRETLLQQVQQLRRGAGAEGGERAGEAAAAAPDEVLPADPLLRGIAALRSGEPAQVRRALAAQPVDPRLVPHLIPLLARNDVFLEVMRALRRLAPRVTGQLLDALLDPEQEPAVRRRIPRVLKACASQRAADGLRLGLADPLFEVRQQCALALAKLREQEPGLAVPAEAVFGAVMRELAARPQEGAAQPSTRPPERGDAARGLDSSRGEGDAARLQERRLEHVFTLLSLVLEREPLQISFWALQSDQPIRGTALEYLDNVLPDDIREALWPYLKATGRRRAAERRAGELRDELLRSSETLAIDRRLLRKLRSE